MLINLEICTCVSPIACLGVKESGSENLAPEGCCSGNSSSQLMLGLEHAVLCSSLLAC